MKRKNLLALFLAVVLCLSSTMALAAEKEKPEYTEENIAKAKEWADTLDTSGRTYDEPMTITLALQYMGNNDYVDGDVYTQWYQKHFNFKWDLIAIPDANGDDKVRTMINSGDVPDVLRWSTFDVNEINSYIDQGLFYKFPDDWKERWPNVAHTQDVVPVAKVLEERNDGTYMLCRATYYHYYPYDTVLNHDSVYLRKDWAEAVGYETKEAYTATDLMEMARLLKEKDPGQVGESLVPVIASTDYLTNLFLKASYPQWDHIYKGEDGQFHWGFADEQTLEGLKLFKQAYDEGLISPEFYTMSTDDSQNTFSISGTAAAWVGAGSVPGVIRDNLRDNFGLTEEDWQHAPIVGMDGAYHDYANDNMWGGCYFSADIDEKTFERMMDVMDFAMSDAGRDLHTNYFQYLDWVYDENGERVPAYDAKVYEAGASRNTSSWPLYDLIVGCGDDNGWNPNPVFKDDDSLLFVKYAKKLADTKMTYVKEGSILEKDWDSYGFISDKQSALTAINYQSIVANLIVAEGDLETNWKNAIAENAYIIDPAVEELNENFGTK